VTIDDWRRRIDELDRKLVELLNERSRCAIEVGHIKRADHLPLYQPERELEVLENVERANPGPLPNTAIRRLFERILDEARTVERAAMHEEGAQQSSEEAPKLPRSSRD
jgi:chorismate mutase